MTVDSYLHRGKRWVLRAMGDRRLRTLGKIGGYGAMGLLASAAGLCHSPQTFALGLVSACTGWQAALVGLGSFLGYPLFWGKAGYPGMAWSAAGTITALLLGKSTAKREAPLLIPVLCGLWAALSGLGFQLMGWDIPTLAYLLWVVLGAGSARLFLVLGEKREKVALWAAGGIAVLALAQIPIPWLNPGVVAAGMLGAGAAFPAAVLSGLALDLARITPVPMTAALGAICLVRMLPGLPRWLLRLAPGGVYVLVMALSGTWDPAPLPGLVLGGLLSVLLPTRPDAGRRRGPLGLVQLRLDMMGQVLTQTRVLLMEAQEPPIDEEALLMRTRERACGGCPNRKACHRPEVIPREVLRRPMTENTALPFPCRKPGRMVLEIRRTQEQYRLLKADRDRRREYRGAVSQQYLFLSEFLQLLSRDLGRRPKLWNRRFSPEVAHAGRSREAENGDRFRHFPGPGNCHYLLLCDGMGTGYAAAQEGRTASELLQRMLCAGFPAEHALESLNSILALRGRAGAVTVDLVRVQLDTGLVRIFKWGAAPSFLLHRGRSEKIGTAGPPPGIGLGRSGEGQQRLSLNGGEVLIIASDGVDGEKILRCVIPPGAAAGELAAHLLEVGAADSADDATVAVLRLHPLNLST